jgi:hypothetical protein
MARIEALCVFEPRPKKGCAQLRRKRFAALCLATQAAIQIGLSARRAARDQAIP